MASRTTMAIAGLVLSLLISVAAWQVFDFPFFFLFIPFVPFLFRRGTSSTTPERRRCPECGFTTRDPNFEFCPRDGTRLEP